MARSVLDGYKNLSTQEIFVRIYDEREWGTSDHPNQPFFSGDGSHNDTVVCTYVKAVEGFLGKLENRPDVVDLGCGDFFVGAQVRSLCNNYIACDIVPKLINYNRDKFSHLNVEFRVLDLTTEDLPDGEIVFIRQVFQHLSNAQILQTLPKIVSKYRYLVLTEHLPENSNFMPNRDKAPGLDTRKRIKSGVVLTSPPFNLNAKDEQELCRIKHSSGLVSTMLYRFW
jgi:hypothetical protein